MPRLVRGLAVLAVGAAVAFGGVQLAFALGSPHASFTSAPAAPMAGQTVKFTDHSQFGDTTDTPAWLWSFGDGSTDTVQSPSHVFISTGVFAVTLVAFESAAAGGTTNSDTTTANVTVTAPPPNSLTLTPDSATNLVGTSHTVTATAMVRGAPAAGQCVYFEVTSGPNNTDGATSRCPTDGNGQISWTYTSDGTPGTDHIRAYFGDITYSNEVTKSWVTSLAPPPPPPPPTLPGDVKITVSGPQSAAVGDLLTFTITAENKGPGPATNVVVTDGVPDGTSFVSITQSQGSCSLNSPTVFCVLGTLDAPSSGHSVRRRAAATTSTMQLVVKAQRSGPVTDSATGSADSDGDPSNNSSSSTVNVGGGGFGAFGTLPPPVQGQSVNIVPKLGTVLVDGVPLQAGEQIPFGAVVDATNGVVEIQSIGPTGQLQSALFFGAVFKLVQASDGATELDLQGGNFGVCGARHLQAKPKPTKRKGAVNTTVVRSLWGQGKGNFTTKGRFAAATVRGTMWLTADRCDGTLTQVNEGLVDVLDLVRNKHFFVAAGHSFIVRPS